MSAAKMMTTTRAGLSVEAAPSLSLFQSAPPDGSLVGGGQIPLSAGLLSAVPSASVMVTSAHARNSSWGPQPTAWVPFLQTPES